MFNLKQVCSLAIDGWFLVFFLKKAYSRTDKIVKTFKDVS